MNLNLSKEQSKDKEVSKSGLKAPE